MQTTSTSVSVVNADGLILGRMASQIAKRLLKGEQMIIVNAEKAVLSGKKQHKVPEAKVFLEVGHQRWGPAHYRRPDRIVRRTIRGMLPYEQEKGKKAYKRVKTFIGIPNEFKEHKMETIEMAQAARLTCPYFTVGEFAKEIGWNPGE